METIKERDLIPIGEEAWFLEQTERILKGIDKREEEVRELNKNWSKTKREYQINVKIPYIASLEPRDYEEEEETEEEAKIKDFAYTEINPYFSLYVENRITRELRERELREKIAKKNRYTDLFYLFNFLSKNPNRDLIRKYKKEERERKERVIIAKTNRKTEDRTVKVSYDYTVSSQKLREDRNTGAAHNTSKRQLKQLEIKALQYKALQKVHKILRELKNRGAEDSFLKSVVIYAGDIISDSEPEEVLKILNELQKDLYQKIKEEEEPKSDIDNLKRYMQYSNRLEDLREYGISYKNLINRDKIELKELLKERIIDI